MSGVVRPVFVFGISGATWRVLEPMIVAGELPHLARLRERGCSGVLHSVKAPDDKHYRPQVAWPTIATGCLPARHGITRFFHSADDLRARTLWDYYEDAGLRVGLYGWPITWPPRPVDGFVIPSHLARDTRTWPRELGFIKALDRSQQDAEREGHVRHAFAERLAIFRALRRHGVRLPALVRLASQGLRAMAAGPEQRALLLRHAKLALNTDLFLHLYKQHRPHFASFHSFLVDLVSHRYWRYHDTQAGSHEATPPLREAVAEAYRHTDRVFGRISAALPADTVIAVVSEHGMQAEPESAEVGRWRYVIRGSRLLELVGLGDQVRACPVARWIACRPATGAVLPTDTAARLSRVRVVETGLPLFQVYERDGEVIVKFALHAHVPRYRRGDLDTLHLEYDGKSVPFADLARPLGRTRSAMHDGEGVFLLAGPGIRPGAQCSARLVDMAPTLLAAAGLAVPPGLDGSVLDVFSNERRTTSAGAAAVSANGR